MSQDQFVIPGDIIIADDCRLGQNVILDGNRVMSTGNWIFRNKRQLG